jgi:hypothetical protein
MGPREIDIDYKKWIIIENQIAHSLLIRLWAIDNLRTFLLIFNEFQSLNLIFVYNFKNVNTNI